MQSLLCADRNDDLGEQSAERSQASVDSTSDLEKAIGANCMDFTTRHCKNVSTRGAGREWFRMSPEEAIRRVTPPLFWLRWRKSLWKGAKAWAKKKRVEKRTKLQLP